MNVLHINQADIVGGAAIAGYRLHQSLFKLGVGSTYLASEVKTSSHRVATLPRKYRTEEFLSNFTEPLGLNYVNHISTFSLPQHPFYQGADVLNFHNLHTGHFNYLALPTLTKSKPAVFTLHDMWSFTGHCAYSYGCERWKTGCGKCPNLEISPAVKRDNTHLEWKLKRWIYQRSHLVVVAPSRWLVKQAEQSILKHLPIYHIPYGIDTDTYQPLDTSKCRSLLNIPEGKKVVMFGANNLTDTRKGGDLLLKAIAALPQSLKSEIVLLNLGEGSEAIAETIGIPTFNTGYVSGDRLKAILYSAADLFVFPSRADNLPLVLQESMACGTPMVSFKIGGIPDLVRPGITGYLAEPENIQDFCHGIIQLLQDDALREKMGQNCRTIALTEYSSEGQAKSYMELYRQFLQSTNQ